MAKEGEEQMKIVGLLFGGLFAAVGLIAITRFGQVTTLTCERVEPTLGSCQLISEGLLGSSSRQIPLPTLKGASVETKTSQSTGSSRLNRTGVTYTYRVILLTESGQIPFTSYSSSGKASKSSIASKINAFVKNPNQRLLTVKQDERWGVYLFGGILVAVGGLIVVLSNR